MRAHVHDLREEVGDPELAEAIARDYRSAPIDARTRAMLDYAVKLTRAPSDVTEADVQALRAHGLDDLAIHDLVQVAAYFNYINRIADGLGVDLEPEMKERKE